MTVLKCKICGGDLVFPEGAAVAECEFCGRKQTVPRMDNEAKLKRFNRANYFRDNKEFDKGAGIYETIVAEFPEEAEAYWGLVLCKYGIDYVDDPATGRKVPTCNRSSYDSVLEDPNYKLALQYAASDEARALYRSEAEYFEQIRQGIIAVSSRETPYDIFICYKERDPYTGDRTEDSVRAQDLYSALTGQGYRVFFSRITLEGLLGSEYEPYIFAALQSAKIMLVVSSNSENVNSPWVKNEWSRYLKLMEKDRTKHLIPCYFDMTPEELPREFARIQGQDMNKLGFQQDLIHGIQKLLPKQPPRSANPYGAPAEGGPSAASYVRRAQLLLEEADFDKADFYFDKALDLEPENGGAYLGKFLAKNHSTSLQSLRQTLMADIPADKVPKKIAPVDRSEERKMIDVLTVPGYLEREELQKLFAFPLEQPDYEKAAQDALQAARHCFSADQGFALAKRFANPARRSELEELEAAVMNKRNRCLEASKAACAKETEQIRQAYQRNLEA